MADRRSYNKGSGSSYGGYSSKSSKAYLEFDGSSKGNPGRGGAGAVLRSEDGNVIVKLQEGLGDHVTNNQAEYTAFNSGMKYALENGYDRIHVRGDSELIVKQMAGEYKTRSPNLVDLHNEARSLKNQFTSFDMEHVPRDRNTEADRLANQATDLNRGESRRG